MTQKCGPTGWKDLKYEMRQTHDTLLTAAQRESCMRFLDEARKSLSPGCADFKVVLGGNSGQGGKEAFATLLGLDTDTQYTGLMSLHQNNHSAPKMAFRRTEGPVEGCIGFHTDSGSHRNSVNHTVQLTLNGDDKYEGGRICYVCGENAVLTVPKRPAGTLTIHDGNVLHGVTRLHRGVRYSLFVVDVHNGLGDADVHFLHAEEIVALQPTPQAYALLAKQKVWRRCAPINHYQQLLSGT